MGSLLLAAALVTETEGGSDRGGEKTTWSTPAQSKKALHLTFITASPITPQDPAPSPAMAPADLLALLEPHGQQHLLDHWDDLDAKQQEVFHAELTALDLKEVCGYFARTAESMKNTTEKLDDKMHPLQESQCGAVGKAPAWAPATPRACTMWACPARRPSSSSRLRESGACSSWQRRGRVGRARSPGTS